jgi:hypothetical protein
MKRTTWSVFAIISVISLLAISAAFQFGPFETINSCRSLSSGTNFITNGSFANAFAGWSLEGPNETILTTTANLACVNYAAELAVGQGQNATGVALIQHLNYNGCQVAGGQKFGLAMVPGLELSLWHRTLNSSSVRFGAVVTFHNGTSKLTIDYLLAYHGTPEPDSVNPDLSAGFVERVVNTSSPTWQHTVLNLTSDFVRYFGVDPTSRHYCINYVGFWQYFTNFIPLGDIQTVRTGHTYTYVTGFELTKA